MTTGRGVGSSFSIRAVAFAIVLTALPACGGLSRAERAELAAEAQRQEIAARLERARLARLEQTRSATATAAAALLDAREWGTATASTPAALRAAALQAAHAGRFSAAIDALQAGAWDPDDVDVVEAAVLAWSGSGEHERARDEAWTAVQRHADQRERLVRLWYRAWMATPAFWRAEPRTLVRGVDLDRIEALGGGSTITLKLRKDDRTIAAFKPHQTREQSNYRAEVAAYRLCALIHCGFQVPVNEEVRIELGDFLRAYGISSLERNRGYSSNFRDLILFTDQDGRQWLHGTMKEWVPGFTTFPVEHTDVWESLLNGYVTAERMESMPLSQALQGLRGRERGNYGGIMNRAEGVTTLDFARQLSNLHVFDFLLNNWDRYSGVFWGVNCQWNHGRFVSIDNGATMQRRSWGSPTAVRNRLRRVKVFSRTTIDAIRWMDTELAREVLFPPSPHHADEAERYELFLERRAWLLEYVDGLIASRGEERVLWLP